MKLDKPNYLPGQKLEDGTLYVGVINDGKKIYHLSVETNSQPDKMTWDKAINITGLPTARELSLISANAFALNLLADEDFYWSSTEYSNNGAWFQRFNDGGQNYTAKDYNYRVRCVRRYLIIQSFDHLLPEITAMKERIKQIEELMHENN